MRKKKKYLITSFSKLNFKSIKNFVFVDEYLFRLYRKEDLKNFNCAFANSINSIENFEHNKNYLLKKVTDYRRQLADHLNAFHGVNYSIKYWGVILDPLLFSLIDSFIKEIKLIKNVKKKFANIWTHNFLFAQVFFDTREVQKFISLSQDYQKLTRTVIAKEIGIKIVEKKNKELKKKYISGNRSVFNLIPNLLSFFLRSYVFLFKPTLILQGYFGRKNSIKIFFKSFGRIFFLPTNKFFYKKKYFFKINEKQRNKIQVLEKDLLDRIFNLLINKLLPVTFLEGFDFIKKQDLFFAKRISKIGSAVGIIANDQFKFLAAEILENKGKLLTFQHGGLIEEPKFLPQKIVEEKYSTKRYLWTDEKGLGQHFLTRYKKILYPSIKNNKQILIFSTVISYKKYTECNLIKNNHPFLDQNYDFFKYLNKENKNRVLIKLFPHKTSENVKKIWKKKFRNNINFAETYSSPKVYFYNSRLAVINDISTPLYELMYIGVPFILISDNNFNELETKFVKKLKKLEKLKIFYTSPIKAAKFVNNNYDTIDDWWKIVSKEKNFINFKNTLFTEKNDYINSITKELINI